LVFDPQLSPPGLRRPLRPVRVLRSCLFRPRPLNEHGVVRTPNAWRGARLRKMAVLSDGSRRLPGITQRTACRRSGLGRGTNLETPIELPSPGAVLGSRLLPTYRAAKLQSGLPDEASRSLRRRGEVWLPSRCWAPHPRPAFTNFPGSFLNLRTPAFLGYSSSSSNPGERSDGPPASPARNASRGDAGEGYAKRCGREYWSSAPSRNCTRTAGWRRSPFGVRKLDHD
jgi:hypothetical protein